MVGFKYFSEIHHIINKWEYKKAYYDMYKNWLQDLIIYYHCYLYIATINY